MQGSGTDTYEYTLGQDPTTGPNFPDGINTWSVEEQETSGEGSTVHGITPTFSNFDGNTMLDRHVERQPTQWPALGDPENRVTINTPTS